jgi:hypothetical protein
MLLAKCQRVDVNVPEEVADLVDSPPPIALERTAERSLLRVPTA